ncbi:ceramide synthase 1-like [Saccoglossus kowalevskii]
MDGKSVSDSVMTGQDSVILPMPGYYQMVTSVVPIQLHILRKIPEDFNYFYQFTTYCHWNWVDAFLVLFLAVFWTATRATLTYYIFKPFVDKLNLMDEERTTKATENLFKSTWYTLSWIYTTSILFSGKYSMFQDPASVFTDWSNGMEVPLDIYILFVYQCGFYVHSIYASIYVDVIRSDFCLIIAHHVLTIMLLAFSFVVRYHKLGVLVIFCHDICDVLLEIAKIFIQTKDRNGKFHVFNEIMANIFFGFFIVVWILCRLYWYPLKVLYAAGRFFFPVAPFVTTFNVMLWLLLMMNIYWFWEILQALLRLVSGGTNKCEEDIREQDGAVITQQREEKKKKKSIVSRGEGRSCAALVVRSGEIN